MTSGSVQLLKADLFRALAHPTRIRLLELLCSGEHTVQALTEAVGVDQPVISQHLAALRGQQLVAVRRAGTRAHYTVADPGVAALLKISRELLGRRLTGSRSMLRAIDRERRRA